MMYEILGIVGLIAFLYVLISVLRDKRMSSMNKAIWIVAGLVFSILTGIVYYVKKGKK